MRIDISMTISPSIPVWPGDPPFGRELPASMARGDEVNASSLSMSAHCGTHVDAPLHFIDGAADVVSLSLEWLIGPCEVVDAREIADGDTIESSFLARYFSGRNVPKRVLFKTGNSKKMRALSLAGKGGTFFTDYVSLGESGAEFLRENSVKLVGVDWLSIGPWNNSAPTHLSLLGAEIIILEGIYLGEVEPGTYTLHCLPLKIEGSDGAPARAILETLNA